MDDPLYQKPPKGTKFKLQHIRYIEIFDTYRLSPKSFVETIQPLMKRGLIPAEVFNTIEREKLKRGTFHLESMENVKKYCAMELHSLSAFMHMIRDACWTSDEIRLKSFHSPAAIASVLLKRINVRAHSWPVKSVNLDDEQIMAHGTYFGGRFEWIPKGYMREPGYQVDEANAYPYGMQFLPSMIGGRWERATFKINAQPKSLKKMIEQSCILSMFRVRFWFRVDAPFYPLPYRLPNNVIRYPRDGYGNYMRDDVLDAFDWCKKFKIPIEEHVIIEEACFFHPAPNAGYPFALLQDVYKKRIEFDKADPKGPEQSVLKNGMNSCYGKLAEKRFRGLDEAGKPIIPPHACPWYASAITAHTRRELMKVALIEPELVIGFATDAIYLRTLVSGIPRLKSDADIAAGKAEKLLGDWCWSKIPAAVFIQSGLALYLDKDGRVMPDGVKCRGLPIKKLDKAQKFLDDVLKAWDAPYDEKSINCFGRKTKPPGRHASVEIRAFMPLHSAIVSPKKFNDLFCKWGDVTKTIWLDDCGGKRTIEEYELDYLRHEAIPTSPKKNPTPDKLSTMKFPDWVENKLREKGRQTAAINQYYKIDATDVVNPYEDDYEDDGEFSNSDNELDNLLEENENIEV